MVTKHTVPRHPAHRPPADAAPAPLTGIYVNDINDPELRAQFSHYYTEVLTLDTNQKKLIAAAKLHRPKDVATLENNYAHMRAQWKDTGAAMKLIDQRIHDHPEEKKDVLEDLRTELTKVIDNLKNYRVASETATAAIERMRDTPVTGRLSKESDPFNPELAGLLTTANHALVQFTDDVTSGRIFKKISNAVSSIGSGSGATSTKTDDGKEAPVVAQPDAAASTDESTPSTGGGLFGWIKKKWNDAKQAVTTEGAGGTITGGAIGVGAALLISSMFGSGPVKWVLTLMLAPFLGILGATQLGPKINRAFGFGGASASTGSSPELARSPGMDGPSPQPDNRLAYSRVRDVCGALPEGVSYNPYAQPVPRLGGHGQFMYGYGDQNPAEQIYNEGRRQQQRGQDRRDIDLRGMGGMTVQGADMSSISGNGVNIYAPNSRVKIIVHGH